MDSFKNLYNTLLQFSRNLSKSTPRHFFSILFTLLLVFFFSISNDASSSISYTTIATWLWSSSNNPQSDTPFDSHSCGSCSEDAALSPAFDSAKEKPNSCDVFDGHWVFDESLKPIYRPGSCPFVDDSFNCFKNGRTDSDYLRLKWKPHGCEIPRFDGLNMLNMLKGKRMVFVGDSLNRNMWESLVCALRASLVDKKRVFEVRGRKQFRSQRFYSFKFKDFNCWIDFVKSPFLIQEWKFTDKGGTRRETLRLDMAESSYDKYHDADVIIFNTGHWWTHHKTLKRNYHFQDGDRVYDKLEVAEAYKRALRTWTHWVDANINRNRTKIFFMGYSASHFKGGQWNSGGSCDGETQPISNETQLAPYPWMMRVLESVISKMKTPIFYLNVTKMTEYRKEGHPSIFRQSAKKRSHAQIQDCSHWCLPGVPDSWNQILYAILLQGHI